MKADRHCKLVAIADAFQDAIDVGLREFQAYGDKCAVDREHCFVGFDAYKRLLESDVDVVLLCEPPHFRPAHLRAAIEAGKHVFAEKPVAVDAPGVRSVLDSVRLAEEKKLSLVSGLCWRYDYGVRETIQRVRDGQIGDVVAIQENYLAGPLWHKGRDPSWSEMEYQLRNWMYFTWLSGDHNVEQHVHSLDKAAWILGEEPPVSAVGLGGRQQRTDPKWGHIFDHHSVIYTYANGVKVFSFTRQQEGCHGDVEDYVLGTKGRCNVLRHTISAPNGEIVWKYRGPKPNMYQVEHDELFGSIRSGQPINNGLYMARSTMLAILGRMCTYTGKEITWEEALNNQESLTPREYAWGPVETPQVAVPGIDYPFRGSGRLA
jgi:predicted dehydrogenase